MKIHIKAALLSACVLPGMGQLFRGRILKGGILLFLVTVLLLTALIVGGLVFREVLPVLHGAVPVDGAALAVPVRRWLPQVLFLCGAFCMVWLYSVVDTLLDRHDRPVDEHHSMASPGGTSTPSANSH